MDILLTVNNKTYKTAIEPYDNLLTALRKLGFKSVKQGCDTGMCGICTVWVNGKPVLSCSTLAAEATGKQITTLEGLPEEAEKFGSCLAAEGADQCGFCSPGLMMTVIAMKKELVNPTTEEIQTYLNGNLCRCTGYSGHLRAVEAYLKA